MRIQVLFLSLLCGLLFAACDDDHFATSASDQPTLSTDTLSMGTLLCGNSSATHLVKLYNHCDGDLRLSSISLRNGNESGFRMNVDGMNGTRFDNSDLLRIAQGDSLFIFVEGTFPMGENPVNLPRVEHKDYIDIVCNQRTKTIILTATSQNVEQLTKVVIDQDSCWSTSELDKQIMDSLIIEQGVTLTIDSGVTIYLHNKAGIRVAGTLICRGTLQDPVIIRGDRTDNLFSDLPYDNLPAQWGSMLIENTAKGCSFVHTDIHGLVDGIVLDSTDVLFESCRLRNSDGNLLTCRMTELRLRNCELSQAAGALLDIRGGKDSIIHCTLANYNFNRKIYSAAVCLSNQDPAQKRYTPLEECYFLNTIVFGRGYYELDPKEFWPDVNLYYQAPTSTDKAQNADSVFCYTFDHCLLRVKGSDNNDFIQTIWNVDPAYVRLDDDNCAFDFHLQSTSPAIGYGNGKGSLLCPKDLDGKVRPDIPTIGCYEVK